MTRVIDEIYICTPSIAQSAVTRALAELDDGFYREIGDTYERKRDFFCRALAQAGFDVQPPQGAYYAVANFARSFGAIPSEEFVDRMIETVQVGGVPSGDFVQNPEKEHWVRFCFAVDDSILEAAATRLGRLAERWTERRYNSAA
jgi:aminotransferase